MLAARPLANLLDARERGPQPIRHRRARAALLAVHRVLDRAGRGELQRAGHDAAVARAHHGHLAGIIVLAVRAPGHRAGHLVDLEVAVRVVGVAVGLALDGDALVGLRVRARDGRQVARQVLDVRDEAEHGVGRGGDVDAVGVLGHGVLLGDA